ncbi:hypothetical protein INT48_004895 [Thamnidium elegans]|uniref:Zn(2)-C6 fungal-type domain-containing protein n=1 Tax=Thamnidium elegans TaxID=101142 RepID=A0A8H7VVF2_9FUNG|nr:hypothetical protein INT48_004895 [Thamnidium elegans]
MYLSSDDATVKRQRVSRACDLCRKKKIKCDGTAPMCSNCQAFNLECSYKDTTKKRGPPKGYIEAIENRLHKLESYLNDIVKEEEDPRTKELLNELQSPLETPLGEQIKVRPQRRQRRRPIPIDITPTATESSLSPTLFNSPTLSQSELPEQQDNNSNNNIDLNDSKGQLSMDENGQVRYLGKSSGFYLLQNSRTYQNGAFHFSGYCHKSSKKDQPIENSYMTTTTVTNNSTTKQKHANVDSLELPPKDLSDHLVVLYLTHFYPVLPMFYKRRLVCSHSPLEPISPLLLNAIYAIASRVTPDERVRSDPTSPDTAGDIFFERAKCLLDDYYDTPRISTVQALLLMASHQMGAMKAARAWLYSGMAFRMAQDLGLNRNCDHWNISPEERERRKRVFWCCFIVDRITSAIYGRSANFEERDCDVPFPSVDDDEMIKPTCKDSSRPPAKLLEVFIQSIKICDILGHVLKNIYYAKARQHTSSHHIDHILTTLNRQLTQWHDNLPVPLQYKLPNTQAGEMAPDPPSPICQLHMIYYTTVILLHRSFIPGPTQSQLPISLPSYDICESAASSVLDIINIMLGENHLKYVYNFSVFFVFTAGIIFIKLASSDDADKAFDAKININRVMRALDELEITWLNAARCCNILGELAGLRDINLECDKYVPKKVSKSSPPPSIAVPNSPELNSSTLPALSSSPNQMDINLQFNQNKSSQSMNISSGFDSHWNQSSNVRSSSMSDYSNQSQQQQPQRSSTDYISNNSYPLFSSSSTPGITSQVPISSVRSSSALDLSNQHAHTNTSSPTSSSFLNSTTPTMDPFAAPGIIPGPSSQQPEQFDPLGTAFWGMPTSLDTDEWNAYFGNQLNSNPTSQPTTSNPLNSFLLSSSSSSSSSFVFSQPTNNRLISKSSVDLPDSPSQSFLLGFLDENKNPRMVSSPSPINATTTNVDTSSISADVRYW